ncbi:GMC family oxidoreductase [Gluconobacter japonicus]|uniref:GMC family oxidoreductase n=1 Tax=Gluconobacter japonicus TaxID=376620 RepID=UPI001B8B3284|nr:GMC family oxidoreductase [Gluconobacter japonicus]MBS1049765.1 GMC family oxidoreductase [Gluconobacter japonicus]
MKTYAETDILDVIIVGSGAGGAPLAARLAQAGKSVLVLEAGPKFTPAHYTSDEIEAREIYWLNERLSGGRNPQPFGGNNSGTGVGGSMLHYGAFLPRPDARDFQLHTETGRSVDWPFRYEELLPYIEEVESFIGVSGPAQYPWDPSRQYAYTPPPANPAALKMRDACDALGLRHADGPTALITRPFNQPYFGERQGCVSCGACHQGCRNGAKSGTDNTWLPLAVAYGAEIRPGCFVHTIETDQAGRVTGVVYKQNGQDIRQHCEKLVLSAGAVETARLLLHNGLANSSGQVGENYMTHISTQIWGEIDQEVRPNRGYPSLTITEDMIRPKDADFAGGYLIQSLGMMPITWASNIARGSTRRGADLVRTLAGYNRSIGMGIHGDCMPSPENRVVLSDEKDHFGIPKPLITHSYGPNELAMHAHASRLLTRMWDAIGAKDLRILDRAAHMMGTARMGKDSGSAVVTPYGQSFDINNLWISDHSTFPSATAANPALTIMALALRTADAMLTH